MDHLVYLDAQAKELENLLTGKKTMIIRGATGRKLSYGRVDKGDTLYLVNNNGEGLVRAKAEVKSAFHSRKMVEKNRFGRATHVAILPIVKRVA
jgi:hypothetical protein